MSHIKDVLEIIIQVGLTANKNKCLWAQTACKFLGHFMGEGRVSPSASNVQAAQDFAPPTTKSGVRQFLGLTGYYPRFIKDYANHVALTEATKKAAPDQVKHSKRSLNFYNMPCV